MSSGESFKAGNLFDVKGLVAVITGGGTGIGLMMTQALASNGARVYIVGRRFDVLEKTSKNHSVGLPEGAGIIPVQGDINSKESIKNIFDQISKTEPHVDILINNSGVLGPFSYERKTTVEEIATSIFESDYEDALRCLQTNILGIYYMSGAFIPLLAKSPNNPQIINITSNASFGRALNPGYVYGASKAAATHLTKILSTELRNTNIRVNAIAPGLFPTEMSAGKENTGEDNRSRPDSIDTSRIPISKGAGGGLGDDADMASAILFLANKRARYSSGSVLLVDGGVLNEAPSTY